MKDFIEQLYDTVRSAWRFRWFGMGAAVLVALLGWSFVLGTPERYEARASVFVDTRSALKPVLQGLAMDQDVSAQLNFVRQSLLSGTALEKIAQETGVLPETIKDPRRRTALLDALSKRVEIQVSNASGQPGDSTQAGSVYTILYKDSLRERALRVTDTLMNTFISETLGGKREGTESAQKFLEAQIQSYESRLRDAENRLAEFKKDNVGLMPTEQGGYFSQLQTEIDAAKKAQSDLDVASSRRNELSRQLRGEAVITASPSFGGNNGNGNAGDTLSRLKEAQARLDDLLLRFTDKHPDVIAARSTLAELTQRRDAEIQSLRRGDTSAAAMSGISSNPVYQSIQLQLNQVDVEIASLRGQVVQHREKAAELRKRLDTAPEVEARFAQLNRDYDINKSQYTALLANYEKVRLGEQADNAGSVRFDIVQPPTAPYTPASKPGLLIAAVFVAALAAAAGLCYGLNLLWPVVASMRDLATVSGLQVIGVVSAAFPHKLQAEARSEVGRYAFALVGLVLAFLAVLMMSRAGIRLSFGTEGVNS